MTLRGSLAFKALHKPSACPSSRKCFFTGAPSVERHIAPVGSVLRVGTDLTHFRVAPVPVSWTVHVTRLGPTSWQLQLSIDCRDGACASFLNTWQARRE